MLCGAARYSTVYRAVIFVILQQQWTGLPLSHGVLAIAMHDPESFSSRKLYTTAAHVVYDTVLQPWLVI